MLSLSVEISLIDLCFLIQRYFIGPCKDKAFFHQGFYYRQTSIIFALLLTNRLIFKNASRSTKSRKKRIFWQKSQ